MVEKAIEQKITLTTMPLIGFSTEFDDSIEHIAEQTLREHDINRREFIIPEIPQLSLEGAERMVFVDVPDLKIGKLENDELNPGKKKIRLTFSLPKGSYATVYLTQLFLQESH